MAKVLPYLSFRSQSVNAARELVGWQTQINTYDVCDLYGSLSITPEYTRSFRSKDVAQALFSDALSMGSCDRPTLRIQGTKVADRDAKALMAENFYLPTDYSSIITLEPRLENFLVDFNFYLGLGNWLEGLYFRVHAPVCYTRTSLNYDEHVLNPGSQAYDPGYFTDTWSFNNTATVGFARSGMLGTFQEYITDGNSIQTTNNIVFDPLCNARWSRCRMTKTRVADLEMALGWNFLSCPDYHLGLQIRGAAPTGNRPTGEYLFEPIIGQGHHWELGGGLTSHYNFWRGCDECQSFDVYLDANITHLFKTRQCRTFDLVNKPLSRYMLAAKFGTPVTDLYALDTIIPPLTSGNGTIQVPSVQFKKEYMPVANITTIPVDVSAAVQADLVLKLAWTSNDWQFDLGYNFWARTCEKITSRCDTCCTGKFPENTWGLKGDAFMFGFPADTSVTPTTVQNQGIGLSATESKATIFKGTNNYPDGLTIQPYNNEPAALYLWEQNPGIDNPKAALWQSAIPSVSPLVTKSNEAPEFTPVGTSLNPVFIKESDLDLNSARQKGLSNKIFAHFGYTWSDHCNWVPYLGVGAEVEFGSIDKKLDTKSKTSCKPCTTTDICKKPCASGKKNKNTDCMKIALSQWGVWIKGGVSFNS